MGILLDEALSEIEGHISDPQTLVRAVLSGRRRNMEPAIERIDIRPVLIKDELHLQLTHTDGRQMTTKNYLPQEFQGRELIDSGYANFLIEHSQGTLSLRITKKGEPLIHRTSVKNEQSLAHDRSKKRLLDPSDPFLIEVGISDSAGKIKASKQDKYLQVEEFLRILTPTLQAAIEAGQITKPTLERPLTIVDLGCGHAYLTFAAHQYLVSQGLPVKVVGIDIREAARARNNEIAQRLGISSSIEFRAEEISRTSLNSADIAIALHACDTATDDALAWAINSRSKLILVAPCCHHNLQTQIRAIPEPWSMITRHGIMKERLVDLMTDALRMQILKLHGYRVEAIEFIGGEHTPRNLMIRAVLTGAKPDQADQERYEEMAALWKVKPALATLLKS